MHPETQKDRRGDTVAESPRPSLSWQSEENVTRTIGNNLRTRLPQGRHCRKSSRRTEISESPEPAGEMQTVTAATVSRRTRKRGAWRQEKAMEMEERGGTARAGGEGVSVRDTGSCRRRRLVHVQAPGKGVHAYEHFNFYRRAGKRPGDAVPPRQGHDPHSPPASRGLRYPRLTRRPGRLTRGPYHDGPGPRKSGCAAAHVPAECARRVVVAVREIAHRWAGPAPGGQPGCRGQPGAQHARG